MFLDTTGDIMLKNIKNRFFIESVGKLYDQNLAPDYFFKGESHPFIEAMFVERGSISVTEDEKVYILNEGDIIFCAPMEFHCVRSYNDTNPVIKNLSFTASGNVPSKIFDGVYSLNEDQRNLFLKCFYLIKEYIDEQNKKKYSGQYIFSFLSALLIEIGTTANPQDANLYEAATKLYKQIVVKMQESVYNNLSLTEIAKDNNISVSYLKKLFLRYANTSPKNFYNSLRASAAANLIKEGISVREVAEKMNFSSPNYFCLFFKKHFGCTPREYR